MHSAKRFDINASQLARFLSSVDLTESILEQRAMDCELHAAAHVMTIAQSSVAPSGSDEHSCDSRTPISISAEEIEEYEEF